MKKTVTLSTLLVLMLLCGCDAEKPENSETRFLMDTVVTLTAECDDETIDGAFALCENLESILSRTVKDSDVYRLNHTDGFVKVSSHTLKNVERALYYAELSGGRFDITVCPVSELWDFKNQIVPDRDEIAEALKNVDYHSVEINDGEISSGGKQIDLGGIAKGYITDELISYFKEQGAESAVISLGGNIGLIGKHTVGIKKPFDGSVILTAELEDMCVSTSGIYERYIEKDRKIYHHIIDPETGYGVENGLASATVIAEKSIDCDALSTVCMLLGVEKAAELIDSLPGTEAVFIDRDEKITMTSGLYREAEKIYFKEVLK